MNSTPSAARLLLAIPYVGEGGKGAEEPPEAIALAEYLLRRGAKWPELLKCGCGDPHGGQNGCKRDAAECGMYRLATLPSPRKVVNVGIFCLPLQLRKLPRILDYDNGSTCNKGKDQHSGNEENY